MKYSRKIWTKFLTLFAVILFLILMQASAQMPAEKDADIVHFTVVIRGVKHLYTYVYSEQTMLHISRQFVTGNKAKLVATTQTFELDNNQLISANEAIVHTLNQRDSAFWSSDYTFEHGKLNYHSTNGHGKSEEDNWDPENEVLHNYHQALYQVKKHRQEAVKERLEMRNCYKEFYKNGKLNP